MTASALNKKPEPSGATAELRRSAEVRLRERPKLQRAQAGGPKSAADTQRLLHELQVDQVELEMQNAELQEGRDRMEVLLEKYTDLYDFAPVGYFSLDESGRIMEANLTGAALLGVERSRLINQPLPRFVAPASQPDFLLFLKRIFAGTEKRFCEAALLKPDAAAFWTRFHGVAAISAGDPRKWCRVAVWDITARKQAELELRESEERFRVMVNALPQLAWIAQPDGSVFWYNQRWYDYTGTTPKQMAGWGWQKVHDPAQLPMVLERWKISLATSKPFEMTFPLRGAAGTFRSFLTRVIPLKNGAGQVIQWFGTNTDIDDLKRAEAAQRRLDVLSASNRKLESEIVRRQLVEDSLKQSEREQRQLLEQSRQMQEQLRQLSRQILSAQEEERKRISRELHDVIAQTLTGINVQLAALAKGAASKAKGLDRSIARTQELVGKSVDIVHEFARELRPAVLDDLGLIPALHSFVKTFSKRTRLHVQLKAFAGVEQLDIAKRTVLFRVAQEALTNVARHAQASRVEVSVLKVADRIGLKIKDDGKSFQVERVLHGKGSKRLGLVGMRERVEMVGGTFGVNSAPGQGTTIQVEIPSAEVRKGPRKKSGRATKSCSS